MAARTFSSVQWVAEHVPELHRTLNNDHTVTVEELPGTVNLYAVIDGGRILMDVLHGGKVLEAITTAEANGAATQTTSAPAVTSGPSQEDYDALAARLDALEATGTPSDATPPQEPPEPTTA